MGWGSDAVYGCLVFSAALNLCFAVLGTSGYYYQASAVGGIQTWYLIWIPPGQFGDFTSSSIRSVQAFSLLTIIAALAAVVFTAMRQYIAAFISHFMVISFSVIAFSIAIAVKNNLAQAGLPGTPFAISWGLSFEIITFIVACILALPTLAAAMADEGSALHRKRDAERSPQA